MPMIEAEGLGLRVRWGQFNFWLCLPVGVTVGGVLSLSVP